MRWELGSVLPPQVKINLSDNELIWFKDYSKLLMSYMGKIGDDMGLNITHDVKPPKTFYIEIKCKIDFGKLQLDSGKIIALKRNSVYHMQRSQCEILVRRGIAEHVG